MGVRIDDDLIRSAVAACWHRDLATNVIRWQPGFHSFGYTPDEPREFAWWIERVHPDDRARVVAAIDEAITSGARGYSHEYRFRRRDDTWADVAAHGFVDRDDGGRALATRGIMVDITRVMEAERALALAHHALLEAQRVGRMRAWEEDLRTGTVRMDFATSLGESMPRYEARPREEAWRFLHPDDVARLDELRRRTIEQGLPFETEYREILVTGEERTVLARGELARDAAGRPARILGTALDITERKRIDEELARRERQQAALARLSLSALKTESSRALFGEAAALVTQTVGVEHADVVESLVADRPRPLEALEAKIEAERSFTDDEVSFVRSIANVLAVAIERERATTEVRTRRQQLQMLSRRLITAQEEERRAIARELHDDFGQVLTALRLNLQRRPSGDTESNLALVDGAILRMRDLATDLRPPQLDELGLESSLRWYMQREAARAGVDITLDIAPLDEAPSAAVATTCFRVAQEALTNVVRHARARHVTVELRRVDDDLDLVVRDDGVGFDVAEARARAARGASQGLLGMEERVELVSGALTIESAPGRGTTVHALLPLARGDRA